MAIDLDGLENAGGVHARAERRRWAMLLHRLPGIADLSDLIVTQRGSGANRSVDVSVGGCFVASSDPSHGLYPLWNTAVLNLPLAAADPSNPRTDAICAAVLDTEQGDLADTLAIGVITGTAGAGAPTPAIPTRRLLLATVRLNAGVTTVTNANITDTRKVAGLWQTYARMHRAAGLNLTGGGTPITLAFDTRTADHGGNIATLPTYVAPSTGLYRVDARLSWGTAGTPNANQGMLFLVYVNGVARISGQSTDNGTGTVGQGFSIGLSDQLDLVVGDQVTCVYLNFGATACPTSAAPTLTYMAVRRVA